MPSGTCKVCGHADERGQSVEWIDRDRTICSDCVVNLDAEQLERLLIEEVQQHGNDVMALPRLPTYQALALAAAVQLALRHPGVPPTTREIMREFVEDLQTTVFCFTPVMREIVRRGWQPQHDVVLPVRS